MTFAFPLGFLGLLSLPVILALHLLRERQRQWTVASLSLWSFLEPEVRGSRLSRIPFSLLLILDLLIATLFSLALSRPQIVVPTATQEERNLVLIIDASTSMLAEDVSPTRFNHSLKEAGKLLTELGENGSALVLTFAGRPEVVGDTRQESMADLLKKVNVLKAGGQSGGLVEAIALARAKMSGLDSVEMVVFTDGMLTENLPVTIPTQGNFSSKMPVTWRLVGSSQENIAVLKFSTRMTPQQDLEVFAQLANFGQTEIQPTVALWIADELAAPRLFENRPVRLPANSLLPQVWRIPSDEFDPKKSYITVTLDPSDALPEDNSSSMGISTKNETRISLVAEKPEPVLSALQAIPNVVVNIVSPSEYSALSTDGDLVILRGWLPESWPEGDVLVLDPPSTNPSPLLPVTGQETILAESPFQADISQPFMAGLDFNGLRWQSAIVVDPLPVGFSGVLQVDGIPIILAGSPAGIRSQVVVVLSELEASNLVHHPAWIILLGNLIAESGRQISPAAIQLGQSIPLPSRQDYRRVQIYPPQGEDITLQEDWPTAWDGATSPGIFKIDLETWAGESEINFVGVEAGDLFESNLSRQPIETAVSQAAESILAADSSAQVKDEIISLIPHLLSLTVLFMLVEAWLAWR